MSSWRFTAATMSIPVDRAPVLFVDLQLQGVNGSICTCMHAFTQGRSTVLTNIFIIELFCSQFLVWSQTHRPKTEILIASIMSMRQWHSLGIFISLLDLLDGHGERIVHVEPGSCQPQCSIAVIHQVELNLTPRTGHKALKRTMIWPFEPCFPQKKGSKKRTRHRLEF